MLASFQGYILGGIKMKIAVLHGQKHHGAHGMLQSCY